jgi:hypothetical protein
MAVGEMGVPALQAGTSRRFNDGSRRYTLLEPAQASFALEQVVVPYPNPPRKHAKPHEACSMAGLLNLALDGMEPQTQGG